MTTEPKTLLGFPIKEHDNLLSCAGVKFSGFDHYVSQTKCSIRYKSDIIGRKDRFIQFVMTPYIAPGYFFGSMINYKSKKDISFKFHIKPKIIYIGA